MRFWWLWLTALVAAPIASASENPCTNGSFEELSPSGFPADWSPVGSRAQVVSDAHAGRRALRLVRTAPATTRETGVNRAGGANAKNGGAMIAQLRGGIDFWYKAVSSQNAQLCVFAIPINAQRVEGTGSPRAQFVVPDAHVGDGQWHRGRLKYDFTDNDRVRWVQFAARIVGAAGELLLDDIAYIEKVGVVLKLGKVRLEEAPDRPGQRCTVRVRIDNVGDQDANDVHAVIEPPAGLAVAQRDLALGGLAPGRATQAAWIVEGRRAQVGKFRIAASAEDAEADTAFQLASGLALRSFGPVAPVAAVGQPAEIECVLENTGDIDVRGVTAAFSLGDQSDQQTVDRIAPGQTALLRAQFVPDRQSMAVRVAVKADAENIAGQWTATSRLTVGASVDPPQGIGRGGAASSGDVVWLANRYLRLAFRRNEFGFGPAELSVARRGGWQTVAWLPRLCRFVYRDANGERCERVVACDQPPRVVPGRQARLEFHWSDRTDDQTNWSGRVVFELAQAENEIRASYELRCDRPCDLLAFDGPMLYVLQRDQAVFPGLEWLVGDEVSSSALDIAEDHPHRIRYVVHPNMVTIPAIGFSGDAGAVGLLWDVHQKWDGRRDRPSAVFASPDRFEQQRAHLAGLFVPTVPDYVETNTREAKTTAYRLEPNRPLRIQATLFADATADSPVAAIEQWIRQNGLPQPAPLPHGSYEREIQFSMQAYLDSLWVRETNEWWLTKGNPVMSKTGRPRTFVADLLVGSMVSPSSEVRRRCRDRAEDVMAIIGGHRRLDGVRFGRRADLGYANPIPAGQLLASRDEDGGWRFDADQQPTSGPFVGRDYRELGPDGALEVGTCARKAYQVLRYARIAGDGDAFQQMQNTLELMEGFDVPRAAQVWEVPVHAPDVLAAADAVEAFVEAYRFSGNRRWLQDAVTWAERGLPFIYLWDDPDKPFLLGASIPVFGATWHRGSWFGRPVQWNGLRYARALLKLAAYDDTQPWRQIAELVIRSAILQQEPSGPQIALWPDNISAIDSKKSAWIFGPQQIIECLLPLIGRDAEPATERAGEGRQRIHITAAARISHVGQLGTLLVFDVTYPRGEQGVVLVSNVGRPTAVRVDGHPIPEVTAVERETKPCWRYDAGNAYLSVRVPKDGPTNVRVEGGGFRLVRRLPWLAKQLAFEFANDCDGWMPERDIADLLPRNGQLVGKISGRDPYLVRSPVQFQGRPDQVILLRMRLTAGTGGQLFWTTASSPGFEEEKSIRFSVIPDREFHEYRLEVGGHRMWAGQTITALRLDPSGGVTGGEFVVDYLRAETP